MRPLQRAPLHENARLLIGVLLLACVALAPRWLGADGAMRGYTREAARLIRSPDPAVRRSSVSRLTSMPEDRSLKPIYWRLDEATRGAGRSILVEALRTGTRDERLHVLRAVDGAIRTDMYDYAADVAAQLSLREGDDTFRLAAARALYATGNTPAIDEGLRHAIPGEPTWHLRVFYAGLLHKCGREPVDATLLVPILSDVEAMTEEEAIDVLRAAVEEDPVIATDALFLSGHADRLSSDDQDRISHRLDAWDVLPERLWGPR